MSMAACSITGADRTNCEDNAPCRELFGLGYVCADNGYCDIAPANPRCDHTFPADLDGRDASSVIVFGNLQDLSLETKRARERSAQLAVKQINAEGALEGTTFALAMCTVEENEELDDLSKEEAAVESAAWLVDVYGVQALPLRLDRLIAQCARNRSCGGAVSPKLVHSSAVKPDMVVKPQS